MRSIFIISIVVSSLASCSINRLTKMGVYRELAPEDYLAYVQDSSVNIIDVRTASEFEKSHIEGAINASYFSGHFKKLVKQLNVDRKKTTLIYCETQHRSLFAAKIFYRNGFKDVIDLDKGMGNWRKKEFPYVEGEKTPQ